MAFSAKTLDFLFENRVKNSKEWYDGHKDDYREYVVKPLAQLVVDLTPTMNGIDERFITEPAVNRTISRVRRDTRFTKDKSLYRDTAWICFMRDKKLYNGLPGFFFELSPRGFRYGCGYYKADTSSLEAMRELILSGDKSFAAALEAGENQSVFDFEGEMYKKNRFPSASDAEQNWLNKKNIDFIHNSTDFNLLFSDALSEKLAHDFELLKPVYIFLMKAEEYSKR